MPRPMLTDLFASGYAVLPTPRNVELTGENITVRECDILLADSVSPNEVAAQSLQEQLSTELGLALHNGQKSAFPINVAIAADATAPELPPEIHKQGYALQIAATGVALTGNSPVGLFYGVQTLVQLFKPAPGLGWTLPACRIEDWPEVELRAIHYDTKHHQETMEGTKQVIERCARYKINAILWEIEDKFAYASHPAIGGPGAFTADQMRHLCDFARTRHVEIVPILQMPSHNGFIAKHARYRKLLEHPANNYMLCPSNPGTIKLYKDLIAELIAATPGGKYFHLGTDEAYFLGQGKNCPCKDKLPKIGQGGIFAEFVTTMAAYVAGLGRTAMYWGEVPLTPKEVKRMPPGTVNAVMQGPDYSRAYRDRGIRELVYTSTQGERRFFPEYGPCSTEPSLAHGRVEAMTDSLRAGISRKEAEGNVLGTVVAAWDDSGLNSETFWLGYTTASAIAWNPSGAAPAEATSTFMANFYGPGAVDMETAYLLLNEAAEFWESSWDRVPSRRGPSFKRQYHPRRDLTLALPQLPDPVTLDNRPFWQSRYADLIAKAPRAQANFAQLIGLLHGNILRASGKQGVSHNLAVLLSIARLLEHQVHLIAGLARAETLLTQARQAWDAVRPADAIAALRSAGKLVRDLAADREARFESLKTVWEKTRLPKGVDVGRKKFVWIGDDTKDHVADRTADLGYLVGPQRDLNLETWADQLDKTTKSFARKFGAISPVPEYLQD